MSEELLTPEEDAIRVWNRYCAVIHTILRERRLNPAWLADKANISHSTVQRVIGQKRPEPPEKFVSMIRAGHALGIRFKVEYDQVKS